MSKYERDLDIWRDVFSHYKLDLRSFLGTFKANSTEYKNYDHFKNSIRKYFITCIQHRDKGVSKQEVLDFYQKYSL